MDKAIGNLTVPLGQLKEEVLVSVALVYMYIKHFESIVS